MIWWIKLKPPNVMMSRVIFFFLSQNRMWYFTVFPGHFYSPILSNVKLVIFISWTEKLRQSVEMTAQHCWNSAAWWETGEGSSLGSLHFPYWLGSFVWQPGFIHIMMKYFGSALNYFNFSFSFLLLHPLFLSVPTSIFFFNFFFCSSLQNFGKNWTLQLARFM